MRINFEDVIKIDKMMGDSFRKRFGGEIMFYIERCNSLGQYVVADAAQNSMHSDGKIYSGCYEYFPTQEDAQKVLDKFQPGHVWEHGDVFANKLGQIMLYIQVYNRFHQVISFADGPDHSWNYDVGINLRNVKFLFNIRSKL